MGGGVVKHHIHNANLMRNGANYCVVVSTAQEFDGSDAGASPDEAKSWGKIRLGAKPVKVPFCWQAFVNTCMLRCSVLPLRCCGMAQHGHHASSNLWEWHGIWVTDLTWGILLVLGVLLATSLTHMWVMGVLLEVTCLLLMMFIAQCSLKHSPLPIWVMMFQSRTPKVPAVFAFSI